jgi:hypothetical protein
MSKDKNPREKTVEEFAKDRQAKQQKPSRSSDREEGQKEQRRTGTAEPSSL